MTPVDNGDVAGCGELFGGGTDRWDHGAVLSVGFRLPSGDVASTNKTVEGVAVDQHTSLRCRGEGFCDRCLARIWRTGDHHDSRTFAHGARGPWLHLDVDLYPNPKHSSPLGGSGTPGGLNRPHRLSMV